MTVVADTTIYENDTGRGGFETRPYDRSGVSLWGKGTENHE